MSTPADINNSVPAGFTRWQQANREVPRESAAASFAFTLCKVATVAVILSPIVIIPQIYTPKSGSYFADCMDYFDQGRSVLGLIFSYQDLCKPAQLMDIGAYFRSFFS